jgi:membrane protease YdiL (CAAX protease family)
MNVRPGKTAGDTGPTRVVPYFVLTYLVSWTGALLVALPYFLQHKPVSKMAGLLMFPVMLLGPSLVGLSLTWRADRSAGVVVLLKRMGRVRLPIRWYALLLLPPVLISVVLVTLKTLVSSAYAPNRFLIGFAFGIAAGVLEELGWTGFALPRMLQKSSWITAGLVLGVLWGCWHLPVIDFLGAAYPHGHYLIPFVAAFIAAMAAIRMIIVWAYSRTGSLLFVQVLHTVSTGSLVALGPASVTPAQEAIWYAAYAAALWCVVAGIVVGQRKSIAQCR